MSPQMKKRFLLGFGFFVLALSVVIVVWQGSFSTGEFGPTNPQQTFIFWAVSTLIFVLMVTLGFILFREMLKLYVARQANQVGSRIRTKLVLGALALSCIPVFCLVLFSYEVMNKSLARWFANPVDNQVKLFTGVAAGLQTELQGKVNAQAALLAARPEVRRILSGSAAPGFLEQFALAHEAVSAAIYSTNGNPLDAWMGDADLANDNQAVHARSPVEEGGRTLGFVELTSHLPIDLQQQKNMIGHYNEQWIELRDGLRAARLSSTMMMSLITLFVLFLTVWIALFLAKQISVPITALLDAANQARTGNLKHRVDVRATDELATLVRAFNQMMQELESSGRELDRRRRFTEAILESIPTGVISVGGDGSIQRVNQALSKILPAAAVARATRLEDLFSREDTSEIRFLMKRARRLGTASGQLELHTENRKAQLAITVSALEDRLTSGFVLVLEDTSELLRAQKAVAWHEVARRVAHEIKNPLTPIALSAERMARHVDRLALPAATGRVLQECAATIARSVESVKALVDEFSQYARFPAAQPAPADLNTVVADALALFKDRLDGISIQTSFAPGLPPVNLDREQFQRVVVNLVDNAADAMQESLVKNLYVATQPGSAETVELVVADSGSGVSSDDKEKLFLPYFSTKNRGTGLGLAIVSHIVAEHGGAIRVEDNQPVGARFTIEIPHIVDVETVENPTAATSAHV
jgi:two-component system, NtrC family, nitrogen regulation sensor histidine kinase NtrY